MALTRYETDAGPIWVEAETAAGFEKPSQDAMPGPIKAGLSPSQGAAKRLDEALVTARPAIEGFRRLVDSLPHKPDKVSLSFGLKASAEVGGFLVFSKAAGEATFQLTLSWEGAKPAGSGD